MVLEVEPRTVHRNEVVDLALEAVREEVARAAEIPLPFLADVADEIDRAGGLDVRALKGADDGEHDGEPAAVVADAGTGERRPIALDLDVRALREDGVEVSLDEHCRSAARAAPLGDDVADAVDADVRQA